MSECRIREMTEDDIPSVMVIERASFPTPWTELMFGCQLKLEGIAINLVILEDEGIIGYATAWVAYDEIHLLSIAVSPGRRERGYGEIMLREVIGRGKAMGAIKVVLEVRAGNVTAQAFYCERGFRVIGKREGYYKETGEDALIMELKLYE